MDTTDKWIPAEAKNTAKQEAAKASTEARKEKRKFEGGLQ